MVDFAGLFFAVSSAMRSSVAYQMAVSTLNANAEAVQILGQPISTGTPMGSIHVSGPGGEASLSFSAEGPGEGTVYVEASKSLGQWKLDEAVLEDAKSHQRIDLAE